MCAEYFNELLEELKRKTDGKEEGEGKMK